MIESSLGVHNVLDTNTGEMHKVDLYNSTAITDTLNGLANDPNRFIQIPLRYERWGDKRKCRRFDGSVPRKGRLSETLRPSFQFI